MRSSECVSLLLKGIGVLLEGAISYRFFIKTTSQHLIKRSFFFGLILLLFFKTANLRSCCGYFLATCQLCCSFCCHKFCLVDDWSYRLQMNYKVLLVGIAELLFFNCSQTKFVAIILVRLVFLCDFLLDQFFV